MGLIAGAIVGAGASLVVLLVYGYFATRGLDDSAGRAFAGGLLLSAVLAFPVSQWLVPLLPSGRGPTSAVLVTAMIAMPLVNWTTIGIAAGAVVDIGRRMAARR